MCGITPAQDTRVRALRQEVTSLRDAAARGEQVPVVGATNPLPWRLSERGKAIVNDRVAGVCYPHLTPTCSASGSKKSFIYREGCWRTASKIQALLIILVPSLRGFVPAFRTGLRSLILGLRILEGQTYSVNEIRRLMLEQGFKALKKEEIGMCVCVCVCVYLFLVCTCACVYVCVGRAKTLILEGLSMIEGCCPVRKLAPALHCLVHYADGTRMHGILKFFWMMSFGKPDPGRHHHHLTTYTVSHTTCLSPH